MKKQNVLEAVNEFPKEINLNDLFERLIVIEKIEKGLAQVDNNDTVPHKEVVAHFKKKWQK